jgi:hypothetical protein
MCGTRRTWTFRPNKLLSILSNSDEPAFVGMQDTVDAENPLEQA